MKLGRGRWGMVLGRALGIGVLVSAVAGTTALQAQQRDQECRCVDTDGNAIADCTCFRMPRVDTYVSRSRPRLGISVDASQGGALDAQGARVTNVLEDGPAWEAGIREGDIITRVDGHSLFEPLSAEAEDRFDLDGSVPVQRLLAIARELEVGQEVNVAYVRDGESRTATVSAEDLSGRTGDILVSGFDGERFREQMREQMEGLREQLEGVRSLRLRSGEPGNFDFRILDGDGGALLFDGGGLGRYGLELVPLNEGLGQYFGASEGVLVVNVAEDSTLGLQPGDVILRIGEREVDTPSRAIRVLGTYGREEDIRIRVRRDGREIEVAGRLGGR